MGRLLGLVVLVVAASAASGIGCLTLDHGDRITTAPVDQDASSGDATSPEGGEPDSQSQDVDAADSSGLCPEHAQRVHDQCVCDTPYVFNKDCSACVPAQASDACPKNRYLQGGSCVCQLGFVDELSCGCAAKAVGAPCLKDQDCFDNGACLTEILNFGWFSSSGEPTPGGSLPGGYCTVRLCNSSSTAGADCSTWQGECVQVFAGDLYGELCLVPCQVAEQCRTGYTCRALEAQEIPGNVTEYQASPENTRYCLPLLK